MIELLRSSDAWKGATLGAAATLGLLWMFGTFGPSGFHDCVLRYGAGMGSQMGTRVVWEACEARFGPPPARP